LPSSLIDNRLQWATYSFMGLVALAAYSQASVQVFRRGNVLAEAHATKKFDIKVTDVAQRGRILTADNRPLATDDETYALQINFQYVPHSEGFFADLAAATGTPASEFRELALSGTKNAEWRTPLTQEQSDKISAIKTEWRADGMSIKPSGLRDYALAEAAAGIVGQVKSGKPLSGLELSQNAALAGKDGVIYGYTDRAGAFLPMRTDSLKSTPKTPGVDILTTVDYDLQQVASQEIRKAVDSHNADEGVAIIMDPATGDILAMANWPSFDPTVEGGKGSGMMRTSDFNAAFQGHLEPGSMFKTLTLAEALDSGAIRPNDHFNCNGQATVGNTTFKCDKGEHHGDLTIADAIAKSCNVTASVWSRKVGHEGFVSYIEHLGLLEKPGIGMPGETGGLYNFKDPAPELQLALNGFGQAINVSPVGVAAAFCMIGNDGKEMFPRLIKRIGTQEFPPEEAAQAVHPEAANMVLKCMEAVIHTDEGTGKGLGVPGYLLAGKTGTAQRIGKGGGHVSNFVGFIPAEHPKAMILVMVDNPKVGGYYGAAVAGPVFHNLAKAVIRRYAIPPTMDPTKSSLMPVSNFIPTAQEDAALTAAISKPHIASVPSRAGKP
jgi:cell division protein FtsI/penicillin-binding protein 2